MHVDNCMQRVYNYISMVTPGYSVAGLLEELVNRTPVDNGAKPTKAWGELSFGANDPPQI